MAEIQNPFTVSLCGSVRGFVIGGLLNVVTVVVHRRGVAVRRFLCDFQHGLGWSCDDAAGGAGGRIFNMVLDGVAMMPEVVLVVGCGDA